MFIIEFTLAGSDRLSCQQCNSTMEAHEVALLVVSEEQFVEAVFCESCEDVAESWLPEDDKLTAMMIACEVTK